MRLAACTLLLVSATGCAPTLTQLVDNKHYREAICAGVDDENEDVVAESLARDADMHVHLHRVTAKELAGVVGGLEDAESIAARADNRCCAGTTRTSSPSRWTPNCPKRYRFPCLT